jgi:hypothetical protein
MNRRPVCACRARPHVLMSSSDASDTVESRSARRRSPRDDRAPRACDSARFVSRQIVRRAARPLRKAAAVLAAHDVVASRLCGRVRRCPAVSATERRGSVDLESARSHARASRLRLKACARPAVAPTSASSLAPENGLRTPRRRPSSSGHRSRPEPIQVVVGEADRARHQRCRHEARSPSRRRRA